MTRIILSTGNIISGGPSIIRKSGNTRSNLELLNSLRSSFLAAQQDYGVDQSLPQTVNGGSNGTHAPKPSNVDARTPTTADAWTAREDDTLYVPRIDWSNAALQEDRSQYEITVKMFFLPTAPVAQRTAYITQALDLVGKELGAAATDQPLSVDLLIVSFPGMAFEGDCEWEADKKNARMGNDADELATWEVLEKLHAQGRIGRLGLAEFGSEKLQRFLDKVQTRPAVDQINVKNCCSVPPPLVQLAKKENIELLTHSDCTDILPSGTLRELLGPRATGGADVLAASTAGDDSTNGKRDGTEGLLEGDLLPEWVVKYTAFVKDRGVIENKGYFASAELAHDHTEEGRRDPKRARTQ
ncbi:glutamate--cysteine ligase regulatory subunit [Microdochium nivale]|nr:glutamate--cysteine ligase regulatory subunit [Microdochium nivale]